MSSPCSDGLNESRSLLFNVAVEAAPRRADLAPMWVAGLAEFAAAAANQATAAAAPQGQVAPKNAAGVQAKGTTTAQPAADLLRPGRGRFGRGKRSGGFGPGLPSAPAGSVGNPRAPTASANFQL